MATNVSKICMQCGRTFTASKGKWAFCSIACKKRYGNRTGYRCKDCRTLPCPYRNNESNTTPVECPNYKWHW